MQDRDIHNKDHRDYPKLGFSSTLMFDINVQNGNIISSVKGQILADMGKIQPDLGEEKAEVARMRIVDNRRAESAKTRWQEDVRAR